MTTEIFYVRSTNGNVIENGTISKTGTKKEFISKEAVITFINSSLPSGEYTIWSIVRKS